MPFDFGRQPAAKRKPSFMVGAAPDPLASVEYTDDLQADAAAELSALAEGYRDRARQEQKRFTRATDSEYWFAVCFRDRESKDAFLAAIKAARLGDKYIDGHALARLLGVDLTQ